MQCDGDMVLSWLENGALTKHVREKTRFMSGQQPSLLDLVISRYLNAVQRACHAQQDNSGHGNYPHV